jgi:hypothetical protein
VFIIVGADIVDIVPAMLPIGCIGCRGMLMPMPMLGMGASSSGGREEGIGNGMTEVDSPTPPTGGSRLPEAGAAADNKPDDDEDGIDVEAAGCWKAVPRKACCTLDGTGAELVDDGPFAVLVLALPCALTPEDPLLPEAENAEMVLNVAADC